MTPEIPTQTSKSPPDIPGMTPANDENAVTKSQEQEIPDHNTAHSLMKVGPLMTTISLAAWLMTGMDNPTTEVTGLTCLWIGTSGAAITLGGAAKHISKRRRTMPTANPPSQVARASNEHDPLRPRGATLKR